MNYLLGKLLKPKKIKQMAKVPEKKLCRLLMVSLTFRSLMIEPDKRTLGWCKVKKDYADGSDSMDLVPIGAWHGYGRKAKWWSPILLALRNEEEGTLQAVCKCMTGFTDQFYKDLNVTYSPDGPNTALEKPWDYESPLQPESNLSQVVAHDSLVCSTRSVGGEICRCHVESCLYCRDGSCQ